MPFSPTYSEATEAQIVSAIMTVTERDMKDALDSYYLSDNLPAFAMMADGEPSAFRYPMLVLGVVRMSSVETAQIDDGTEAGLAPFLDQALTVGAGMVVDSTVSVKDVRAKLRKYVRAFRSVIRSAAPSDLLPATARVLNHSIDIEHRYLEHKTEGTNFLQGVIMEIKIKFGEN